MTKKRADNALFARFLLMFNHVITLQNLTGKLSQEKH